MSKSLWWRDLQRICFCRIKKILCQNAQVIHDISVVVFNPQFWERWFHLPKIFRVLVLHSMVLILYNSVQTHLYYFSPEEYVPLFVINQSIPFSFNSNNSERFRVFNNGEWFPIFIGDRLKLCDKSARSNASSLPPPGIQVPEVRGNVLKLHSSTIFYDTVEKIKYN